MKHIIVILMLTSTLFSKWTFTDDDLVSLSDYQNRVYVLSMEIGEMYGLGNTLAKIAAVETRFGLLRANNGKYCGPMQIAVKFHNVSCEALRSNIYLSVMIAAKEILWWLERHNGDIRKALVSYNGGHSYNPHGEEYLKRIDIVDRVLSSVNVGYCLE